MQAIKRYFFKPLVIIGAFNWGLVGFFHFDMVAAIFGHGTMLTRVIYCLVGVSALIYSIILVEQFEHEHNEDK